jgi:hypothetical protein
MKVYLLDERNIFIGTEYVNPMGVLPRCATKPPPETTGDEVACFIGNNWVVLPSYPTPSPTTEPIPQSITPRQARLKLLEADLLDNLEAVITTNRAWQIEWEYATEVKRDSPLIDAVASEASLTSDQIDQMFIEASEL